MDTARRTFSQLAGLGLASLCIPIPGCTRDRKPVFGLIGQIEANPGKGRELAKILAAGSQNMPGNIAYIVALDKEKPDLIWVTEIWDSSESHQASLKLDSVQAAITQGRPMIAGFGSRHEILPI